MNRNMFSTHKKAHQALVCVGIASAFLLTSCTLDGGTGSANKERTMASTEREYLSVSNEPGKEPTIGKPSGDAPRNLISRDIIVGTGTQVEPSSTLTVQYVLISWKTGKVLSSSWSGQPAIFALGGVIQGWQQGIPGMKVGGRRLLVIPPELAYGATGSGPIGPDETLAFVVDLVNVT